MDAVKFFSEYNRMCKTCVVHNCKGCYLDRENMDCSIALICDTVPERVSKFVALVEQWSKDNPKKTILDDLLEKYPNVCLYNGFPQFCPSLLGYKNSFHKNDINNLCDGSDCKKCWCAELE